MDNLRKYESYPGDVGDTIVHHEKSPPPPCPPTASHNLFDVITSLAQRQPRVFSAKFLPDLLVGY